MECKGCDLLRTHVKTSWSRGYQSGFESNKSVATIATQALEEERLAHKATNICLTELTTRLEDNLERLEKRQKLADVVLDAIDKVEFETLFVKDVGTLREDMLHLQNALCHYHNGIGKK